MIQLEATLRATQEKLLQLISDTHAADACIAKIFALAANAKLSPVDIAKQLSVADIQFVEFIVSTVRRKHFH
jgi:hypothetical protein